jgi:hypothetical protein
MSDDPERNAASSLFGDSSEADRIAALDLFGKLLIESRDHAILQWDHIVEGNGKYPPWERLLERFPDLDERTRHVLRAALPHMIDTFMYCLLDRLDGSKSVRVSVDSGNRTIADIARASWGLAAEPTGKDGWLARFSKQRFEQPGEQTDQN